MMESKNPNRRYFWHPVDKRSRKAMTDYLSKHFRYPTGNSWNQSTSYACNLKVTHLDLDHDTQSQLLDLVFIPEFQDAATSLIYDFAQTHNFCWQAGWNGRSGGYLVLYQGVIEPSGYRSFCTNCGQKSYITAAEKGSVCGRCREPARVDFATQHMVVKTYPFKPTDQEQDYEGWELWQLQQRTELIQAFDKLADDIVTASLQMAQNYVAVEEVYYEPRTRMVLKEVAS